MEGNVTISIDDFERLRRYENAVNNAYKSLSECNFSDNKSKTVNAEPVLKALTILTVSIMS